MNSHDTAGDGDHTTPPLRTLRENSPAELYRVMPEVGYLTKNRPLPDEDGWTFLDRCRFSTAPEDAVAFTSFAAEPKVAIGWAAESLRITLPELTPEERQLMSWVIQWLEHASQENRWRVLQVAMFAPRRSPVVYLGLAVGWSGGALAPNDPAQMPAWRTPRAVNAAIMNAVAKGGLEQRSVNLARVLDLAAGLFRVY